MTENINKFTEMEYRVIDELKEVYDPVVMTEEEEHIEFVRIGNAIGIEAFEVKEICERWMKEELLLAINENEKQFSSDSDENYYQLSSDSDENYYK